MGDKKRIGWLVAVVALSFFAGILLANRLWFADRLYPLDPILSLFSSIPPWVDYVLTPLLLILLALAGVAQRSKRYYIVAALAVAAFLFLEDQGRLFPSFYEYSLLLFVLAFYYWRTDDQKESGVVLNACRLAVIFVYIWTGAQKINPFFEAQIAWVVPFLHGTLLHIAGIIAPLVEIEIGIGLFFKRTRNFALAEAILMHGSLLFLIGPLRDVWNEGAWAWNLASGLIVFVLFFRTRDVGAKDIIRPRARVVYLVALIAFGILPALNFVDKWDSALSFNVYSGNIAHAQMQVAPQAATRFPGPLQKYLSPIDPATDSSYFFDISQWSEDELHAEPYPEPRVYENIGRALCGYAETPSDIELFIEDKLTVFQLGTSRAPLEEYDCGDLVHS